MAVQSTVPSPVLNDVIINGAITGAYAASLAATFASTVKAAAENMGHLQVGPDHRLYGQDGKRLYLRGVHAFNDSFAIFSDGYRVDWNIRYSQFATAAVSPPVSRSVELGKWLSYSYVDDATARAKLVSLRRYGFNCIRLWVETGMVQTAAFTDAVTGLSFPTELEILDKIIKFAAQLGMVVWLSFAQESVPNVAAAAFWAILADRYKSFGNVILDIQNEPGLGVIYADPNNPTTSSPSSAIMSTTQQWQDRFGACLTAIRGAGFTNPVAVSPLANLWAVSTIAATLDSVAPFNTDPNLIVGVHIYYLWGDVATPFSTDLPTLSDRVYNYTNYHCVVCSEFGASPDFAYADSTAAMAWNREAAGWLQQDGFNGTMFFTTQPQFNNYNDILDNTGALTTWGTIVKTYAGDGAENLAYMVPKITTTAAALTDYTGTVLKWRRVGLRVDVRLDIQIVTNGSGAGVLMAQLPTAAPSDSYQVFTGYLSSGASVLITVIGRYAQITNLDGTYPGASGRRIQANFCYYARSSDFSYTPQVFDGTYRLERGGLITGLADGQAGTVAFALSMTGGDGTQQRLLTSSNSRFSILRNSTNQIQVQLRNAANTIIGTCISLSTITVSSGRRAYVISWDLSTTTIKIYQNGVDVGSTTTATNDTIDYTDTDFAVGSLVGGGQSLLAKVDFLWFHDVWLNPGTAYNYAAFFDYKNNSVDLGFYGDKLIGLLPRVFLRQVDTSASFITNKGSGGGFTSH